MQWSRSAWSDVVPGRGAVTVSISHTWKFEPGAGVESAAILARVALSPGQGGEGEGGAAGGGYIPPYTFSQNSVLRWFCGYLAKKRTGHPLMWKAVGIRFKEGRDVGMAISGV